MKIALAQQNYHIGNFEENTAKAIEAIKKAKKDGADIIMFTELSVCGYPPRDFLEFEDFINKCEAAINVLKQHADTIAVIVGAPQRNKISEGKNLFNAAWFLYDKEVLATSQKTLLPTYDVFDENRYFEPAYQWNVIHFKGKKIALTICEDIWNLGDNPLYRICPMDLLMEQSPDLMLNISASPFDYDHDDDRKEIIRANVLKYKLPIFYCNAVGSQTEVVFDGGSLVMNAHGKIVKELAYFREDYLVYDSEDFAKDTGSTSGSLSPDRQFDNEMRVFKMNDPARIMEYMVAEKNISEIHQALVLGIRDYFSKLGFTKAILGSSGGIDSAVTLALAVEALGHENVRAVLLPSQYSTSHSVTDAELLSQRLNNPYEVIEIKSVYESLMTALKPAFKDLPFSVAEENLQSRTRGNILMAISNKFGYILLNTSNKSELATGYGTLYGDMAGGLSVLGDVYKTQVYALARHINKNKEIIPVNII
jgi:NAD+ synthase (glutamine-hydrolysing)